MPPKHLTLKPEFGDNSRDERYWEMCQDIAFRAGFEVIVREDSAWARTSDSERLICKPMNPEHIWFETWTVLHGEYPALSRLWDRNGPKRQRKGSQ